MNLEFIKPQNLGSLLMKSSQSNFNLRSPGSYLIRSYLITTVNQNIYYIANFLEEKINFQLDLKKMNAVTLRVFCHVLHID